MATSEQQITVAVVDDHSMVAEGLSLIISAQSDMSFVGIASTVAEALLLVEKERPQVVLMDYHLPDGDGVDAARQILGRWPETNVVMLTGGGAKDLLARSIEVGCVGLLAKDRPGKDIIAAVRSASRGEPVLRTDELVSLLGRVRNTPKQPEQWLSTRELEVLQLLAEGRSTEKIARDLFISVHTVRNHVRNILFKLDAHSKLEAVAMALRDGIVTHGENI